MVVEGHCDYCFLSDHKQNEQMKEEAQYLVVGIFNIIPIECYG